MYGIGNNNEYYSRNLTFDSAEIHNGFFKITRTVYDSNPYPYIFHFQNDSIDAETGFVFLEPKDELVIIDTINEYIAPVIANSKIQNELKYQYEPFLKNLALKSISLEEKYVSLYKMSLSSSATMDF